MPDLDPKGIEAAVEALDGMPPTDWPRSTIVQEVVTAYLKAVPMVPEVIIDSALSILASESATNWEKVQTVGFMLTEPKRAKL